MGPQAHSGSVSEQATSMQTERDDGHDGGLRERRRTMPIATRPGEVEQDGSLAGGSGVLTVGWSDWQGLQCAAVLTEHESAAREPIQ